jgi:predicted amidophosphoribosyltransferase
VALTDLKTAFESLALDRVIKKLNDTELRELPDLTVIRQSKLTATSKASISASLMLAGKRLAFRGQRQAAIQAFEFANDLGNASPISLDRVSLTARMPNRSGIDWRINLQEMQRQLGCICTKTPCACKNHFEMAHCLGIFGSDKPESLAVFGHEIAVISIYHSWTASTTWSKLVKKIKHEFQADLVPFMARVASDFMLLSARRWCDADVLVPVPPSPSKYGKRGFAPTDLIAKEMSSILGIPWRAALVRKPGPPTREATYVELAAQFSLDERRNADLKGANIVLVEDVVTTGKTVSICVAKLQPVEPGTVSVIAMARSTRI